MMGETALERERQWRGKGMKALWALHVWQQDGVAHTHRRTNNKQTTRQSEIPLTQQSEIPLTLKRRHSFTNTRIDDV